MSDTRKEVFKNIHERCFQFGSCNYKETGCSDCPINVILVKAEILLDKQEQGLLIEKSEFERYKLALFGVIRNSKIMPTGLALGRSMEEINAMALKTMEEVLKMCDFDKMKQFYSEAEEALAKMGGK